MTAVMAASNSEGETDVSIEQSDAAVAINRAAKRTRDIEAQFPLTLASFRKTAARYDGAMHACLIDMWCGNHNQGTYPPNTQFLPADGVAAILAAGSFSVARHFSRDQVGSTCGHVAVGVVSQCADQLAQGKAANHLSFDLKKATCMRRIIEASSALGESKALARNATDAPFLNNLGIEALVGSADVQQKVAIRRLLSLLNGGARVSKERLVRSRHGSTCDEGGGGTKAADSVTMISHFDFVVVVYEIGEDGKSERTWKWYLAQVQRMYKVHEKGGKPTKYTDPVALGDPGVHLRVKLLGEAAVKRVGSSLRDPCCFMLEGMERDEHDAIPIHTVLAKVSFSSVEEEEGDDGEPALRYYISREDRDYFNKLTEEICDSVVNSAGAQEEGEQLDSKASASGLSSKRKRTVKPREDEAKGVREAILRKLPKPTNSARPVQHVQRSGRASRKPVDVYSALHCA